MTLDGNWRKRVMAKRAALAYANEALAGYKAEFCLTDDEKASDFTFVRDFVVLAWLNGYNTRDEEPSG